MAGALAAAALGAPFACPALRSLNLGRNLLSAEAKERVEALVQTSRVQLRTY